MDPLPFAINLAKSAGKILRDHFETTLEKYEKGASGRDFATKADLESEQFIKNTIQKAFPDHGILAEESGSLQGKNEFLWIIDPLDGTTNFSRGIPLFTVSIALAKNGKIICGVIYEPMRDECFWVEKDRGAYVNNRKLVVSSRKTLRESILAHNLDYVNEKREITLHHIQDLIFDVEGFRLFFSVSLEMCYVAAGRMDGYIVTFANPWDVAAAGLLIQEAGGTVTHLDGSSWNVMVPGLIASNGLIHEELLRKVNQKI